MMALAVGLIAPAVLLCAAGVLAVVLLREGRRAHRRSERIARRTTTPVPLISPEEIDRAWIRFNLDRLEDL
ncbi:hypothetical protein [Streptomyces liangshanensis]|uniref:hypothetical protein n=1 Tax=Streptomyces liangshanensis TaxID=2717324 RepID=UPI0036DE1EF9